MEITEREKTGRAYHEAGHAVLQQRFGRQIDYVSIVEESEAIGGVSQSRGVHSLVLERSGALYEGTPEYDRHICHLIMISLAGEVAEAHFCAESVEDHHARFDRQNVERLIRRWNSYAKRAEREAKVDELCDYTFDLITAPRCAAAVEAVARELIKNGTLLGEFARKIIGGAWGPGGAIECPHCENSPEYR
jgi:hypothetical protein